MGLFVVFEGVEGSGKSTQARALKRRLTRAGYRATLIHEPGGTPTGERIRRWLKGDHDISPLSELFLFSAARAPLVVSVISPALDRGEVVVCDRYTYSTVAYQGSGRGLDPEMIRQVNEIASGGLMPELVVLLDLPPSHGLSRKSGKPLDRIERERDGFHQRVRQAYLAMAREEPDRWCVIDVTKPTDEVGEIVWRRVQEKMSQQATGDEGAGTRREGITG